MANWMRSLANAAGRETGVYIGLMSGTSADGVDAAAVVLTDGAPPRELGFHTFPYPGRLRDRVLRAVDGEAPPSEVNELHMLVGEAFGMATQMLLEAGGAPPAEIVAVGSHGQTVWHRPPGERSPRGATLQLGNPAVIAARAGVPVVSDFRSADMAQDGQGAPLVPYVDWMLFAHPTASRALQNIGGIANVTFLAAGDGPGSTIAFDTGPGNALIDVAAAELTRGAATMDVDGSMAAQGTPDEDLLSRWLAVPYCRRPPPKSTGRELFGKAYALRLVEEARRAGRSDADAVATITAFTARSIADAYDVFFPTPPDEIVVSGGGRLNPTLMRMLREALDAAGIAGPFRASEDWGVGAESKEALAFAILARETLRGIPANMPSVTGARLPVILGSVTPAPPSGA